MSKLSIYCFEKYQNLTNKQSQENVLLKDVTNIIANQSVNFESKLPYDIFLIEKAIKDCQIKFQSDESLELQVV